MKFFGAPDRPGARGVDADRAHPTQSDIKAAYDQGRRDQRRRRRSHPLMMLTLMVLAVVGAAVLGLAVWTGSFGRGGQVADRELAEAAQQAAPAVRDAAASATDAVRSGANTSDRDRAG